MGLQSCSHWYIFKGELRKLLFIWLKFHKLTFHCFMETILPFTANRDTTKFFAARRVTVLMPRVCFKPIKWYTDMHHMRTILSAWCDDVFSKYVMFIHSVLIDTWKAHTVRFVCHTTVSMAAVYPQLRKKCDQDNKSEQLFGRIGHNKEAGVLLEKLGGGVRPPSQNPYPIYNRQNLRYSLPSL